MVPEQVVVRTGSTIVETWPVGLAFRRTHCALAEENADLRVDKWLRSRVTTRCMHHDSKINEIWSTLLFWE
jgi:hypothetical protein